MGKEGGHGCPRPDSPDAGPGHFCWAEDVTPTVQVGQHVTPSTVIGDIYEGGGGIETGWAQPSALSAGTRELPEAGAVGGSGPFPTMVGLNFNELLISLGVPAAANRCPARLRPSSIELPGELTPTPSHTRHPSPGSLLNASSSRGVLGSGRVQYHVRSGSDPFGRRPEPPGNRISGHTRGRRKCEWRCSGQIRTQSGR